MIAEQLNLMHAVVDGVPSNHPAGDPTPVSVAPVGAQSLVEGPQALPPHRPGASWQSTSCLCLCHYTGSCDQPICESWRKAAVA